MLLSLSNDFENANLKSKRRSYFIKVGIISHSKAKIYVVLRSLM